VIVILATGVIEVYRYSTSDAAKSALHAYATAKAKAMKAKLAKRQKDKLSSSSITSSSGPSSDSSNHNDEISSGDGRKALHDVISFDDDLLLPLPTTETSTAAALANANSTSTNSTEEVESENAIDTAFANMKILTNFEPILEIEKDAAQFTSVPRIILSKSYSYLSSIDSLLPPAPTHVNDSISSLVQFTPT
jgi:hypothetical protein